VCIRQNQCSKIKLLKNKIEFSHKHSLDSHMFYDVLFRCYYYSRLKINVCNILPFRFPLGPNRVERHLELILFGFCYRAQCSFMRSRTDILADDENELFLIQIKCVICRYDQGGPNGIGVRARIKFLLPGSDVKFVFGRDRDQVFFCPGLGSSFCGWNWDRDQHYYIGRGSFYSHLVRV
jgi:hypothetical protein